MSTYNVYENEKFVKAVEAKSAKAAIGKVENKRKGHLFNPFAVNAQDANDTHGDKIDSRYKSPDD